MCASTVEPPKNGDKCFVHCSEVTPSSEVHRNVWAINRQGVNSLSIVGRLSTLESASIIRGSTAYPKLVDTLGSGYTSQTPHHMCLFPGPLTVSVRAARRGTTPWSVMTPRFSSS